MPTWKREQEKKTQEATYARMAPCKNHATKDAKMEDGAEKKRPENLATKDARWKMEREKNTPTG
jgi:hypothetical protein